MLCHFIDFDQIISLQPLGQGLVNDTFLVEYSKKNKTEKCVLQRINHEVFRQPEAVMENLQVVATHLSEQEDYPLQILAPLPSDEGAFLFQDEKGYWRVFPFFEDTFSVEKMNSPEQAFEAAKAFGAFLRGLGGIKMEELRPTIPGFHDGMQRLAAFHQQLKNGIPERRKKAAGVIDQVLEHAPIFDRVASLPLPRRAIHHDTKISNLLFDHSTQKPTCVIDLDTVMPGIVLSDFGDLMRTGCHPASEEETDLGKVGLDQALFAAVQEGFLVEMAPILTEEERVNLTLGGPWLTLMQAMRFLTDYLAGDRYYKTGRPDQNLDRTKNQLALFHSMQRHLAG